MALLGHAGAQAPAGYELALVDLEGNKDVLGTLPPSVFAPRISPDGRRVVFELAEPSESPSARLWIAELSDLDARRRLPHAPGGPMNFAALWSVDGRRVVFVVAGDRRDALFWRPADGSGDAEHLIDARSEESWAPDGSLLSFLTLAAQGDYGISLLDMKSRAATIWLDLPE